jgi:hypothetical protein
MPPEPLRGTRAWSVLESEANGVPSCSGHVDPTRLLRITQASVGLGELEAHK